MDDNYTKFPNDILERLLRQRLSASQLTVALYVVRKTYGWGKGSFGDSIAVSEISRVSNFSRRAIINAVHDLEKMGILEVTDGGSGRLANMRIRGVDEWDRV